LKTGLIDTPVDALVLLNLCKKYNSNFLSLTPQDITAYTFKLPASPFVASLDDEVSIDRIKNKIKELQNLSDILIVEGAGGLLVPISKEYFMIDLIKDIADLTLLVTPSKLGCINDTLLSIEALKNRDIKFDWCVNIHENRDSFKKITEPFYNSYFDDWWSLQDGLDSFLNHLM